jgi:hypothetical protein
MIIVAAHKNASVIDLFGVIRATRSLCASSLPWRRCEPLFVIEFGLVAFATMTPMSSFVINLFGGSLH